MSIRPAHAHHGEQDNDTSRGRGWLLDSAIVLGLLAFGYFILMLNAVPHPAPIGDLSAAMETVAR